MASFSLPRRNEGLLQRWERPALRWLCQRMPHWVTPDILTTIGFLGAIMTAVGYAFAAHDRYFLLLASLGLIINWFGDSMDGNLARYRKIERPTYGFFVDHTTDVFEQVIIAAGLAVSGFYTFELVVLGLAVYLLLSIFTFVRAHILKVLQISYSGFGPTEMRALLILGCLVILAVPPEQVHIFESDILYTDILALLWILGGACVLVHLVVTTLRALADAERTALADVRDETTQP